MKPWLCLFLLLPLVAKADKVLVTESFEETDTTVHQGKKVSWFSDEKGSINVVNDPGLASGKAFKGNKIVGILPFVLLSNPGDSITVSFTFRLAGPMVATQRGFKLGLFEGGDPNSPWFFAAGTGYRWNVTTGPEPFSATLAKESGGPGQKVLAGQDTTVMDQSAKRFAINDTSKHKATIKIDIGADGNLHLKLTIDDWSFASTDLLPPPQLSPNDFAIRSDDNAFLFDDFKMEIKQQSGDNSGM